MLFFCISFWDFPYLFLYEVSGTKFPVWPTWKWSHKHTVHLSDNRDRAIYSTFIRSYFVVCPFRLFICVIFPLGTFALVYHDAPFITFRFTLSAITIHIFIITIMILSCMSWIPLYQGYNDCMLPSPYYFCPSHFYLFLSIRNYVFSQVLHRLNPLSIAIVSVVLERYVRLFLAHIFQYGFPAYRVIVGSASFGCNYYHRRAVSSLTWGTNVWLRTIYIYCILYIIGSVGRLVLLMIFSSFISSCMKDLFLCFDIYWWFSCLLARHRNYNITSKQRFVVVNIIPLLVMFLA